MHSYLWWLVIWHFDTDPRWTGVTSPPAPEAPQTRVHKTYYLLIPGMIIPLQMQIRSCFENWAWMVYCVGNCFVIRYSHHEFQNRICYLNTCVLSKAAFYFCACMNNNTACIYIYNFHKCQLHKLRCFFLQLKGQLTPNTASIMLEIHNVASKEVLLFALWN